MTGKFERDQEVANLLRQLNTKIQRDPAHKMSICRDFYADQVSAGNAELADVVLTVRSMIEAGEEDVVNQTEHLRVGMPVLIIGMLLGALTSLASIGGGWYAISKAASGDTHMTLWGTSISTQNVGVALVFVGVVGLVVVIRAAFERTAPMRR